MIYCSAGSRAPIKFDQSLRYTVIAVGVRLHCFRSRQGEFPSEIETLTTGESRASEQTPDLIVDLGIGTGSLAGSNLKHMTQDCGRRDGYRYRNYRFSKARYSSEFRTIATSRWIMMVSHLTSIYVEPVSPAG